MSRKVIIVMAAAIFTHSVHHVIHMSNLLDQETSLLRALPPAFRHPREEIALLLSTSSIIPISDVADGGGEEDMNDVKHGKSEEIMTEFNDKNLQHSYQYKPPSLSDDLRDHCGTSPIFEDYFALSQRSRSGHDEDQVIFNSFFNQAPNYLSKGYDGANEESLLRTGTYVELGAFDGKKESNSRFFDICLGWEGLLIEGNPRMFKQLVENRPNAHRMNFAPSCREPGENVTFYSTVFSNAGLPGHAKSYDDNKGKTPSMEVPCGPLGSVLENMFRGGEDGHEGDNDHHSDDGTTSISSKPRINFFSLDVEGSEMLILDTIDFNRIHIDIIMIEVANAHCRQRDVCQMRDQVRAKMKGLGYHCYEYLVVDSDVCVHPKSPFQKIEPDNTAPER
mmetsp:Transcript_27274/g.41795  ORF Transcript_27274/g.41795 Transcript_27274/m.41795 type:complete len:392 (+) Transcript_27274:242-1417(+)